MASPYEMLKTVQRLSTALSWEGSDVQFAEAMALLVDEKAAGSWDGVEPGFLKKVQADADAVLDYVTGLPIEDPAARGLGRIAVQALQAVAGAANIAFLRAAEDEARSPEESLPPGTLRELWGLMAEPARREAPFQLPPAIWANIEPIVCTDLVKNSRS